MLDVDTFLTALYVIVDNFCQFHRPQRRRPGPEASLSEGEIIALSILASGTDRGGRPMPLSGP